MGQILITISASNQQDRAEVTRGVGDAHGFELGDEVSLVAKPQTQVKVALARCGGGRYVCGDGSLQVQLDLRLKLFNQTLNQRSSSPLLLSALPSLLSSAASSLATRWPPGAPGPAAPQGRSRFFLTKCCSWWPEGRFGPAPCGGEEHRRWRPTHRLHPGSTTP